MLLTKKKKQIVIGSVTEWVFFSSIICSIWPITIYWNEAIKIFLQLLFRVTLFMLDYVWSFPFMIFWFCLNSRWTLRWDGFEEVQEIYCATVNEATFEKNFFLATHFFEQKRCAAWKWEKRNSILQQENLKDFALFNN